MINVGFIGAGNMGAALATAAAKAEDVKIYVSDKDEEKVKTATEKMGAKASDNVTIAKECDYIFLAVKPNIISDVAKEIRPFIENKANTTIISMAAGVSVAKLEEALGNAAIIRIMPNTPSAIGKGVILYVTNKNVTEEEKSGFIKICENAGVVDEISEHLIDAASALSGCGPAFVYMFIEALSDGAVECGLPRDKAQKYACETLIGAAELLKSSEKHPGELKDAVCSPGGSTIAGVHSLEDCSFRAATAGAVVASYKKTLTLGK